MFTQVSAYHEDTKKSGETGETSRRLFIRQYRLPKDIDVEHLKPSLSQDGVLTVEAPVPASFEHATERLIPIEYNPAENASAADGSTTATAGAEPGQAKTDDGEKKE